MLSGLGVQSVRELTWALEWRATGRVGSSVLGDSLQAYQDRTWRFTALAGDDEHAALVL